MRQLGVFCTTKGFGLRNGEASLLILNATKYDLKRLFECYQAGEDTLKAAVIKLPVMQQMAKHGDISKVLAILLRDLPGFFEDDDVTVVDVDALNDGGEL